MWPRFLEAAFLRLNLVHETHFYFQSVSKIDNTFCSYDSLTFADQWQVTGPPANATSEWVIQYSWCIVWSWNEFEWTKLETRFWRQRVMSDRDSHRYLHRIHSVLSSCWWYVCKLIDMFSGNKNYSSFTWNIYLKFKNIMKLNIGIFTFVVLQSGFRFWQIFSFLAKTKIIILLKIESMFHSVKP